MLKTNREIVSHQLQDLINVAGSGINMLRALDEDDCKLKGDCKHPIEATIVNALNRLDQILRDDSKWTLPERDGHNQFERMGQAQGTQVEISNQAKLCEIGTARRHNEIVLANLLGKLQADAEEAANKKKAPSRKK